MVRFHRKAGAALAALALVAVPSQAMAQPAAAKLSVASSQGLRAATATDDANNIAPGVVGIMIGFFILAGVVAAVGGDAGPSSP